ncbi:unnamed protein product [Symbiodinium sp. CCMP2456]|nr:unnamed protein product [Symbiodinium sp. CCMP2456]
MFGDILGNGGLSLRDREAMLNITKSFRPNGWPEDLWFCSHLQSGKLPSREVAKLPGRPFRHGRSRSRILPCRAWASIACGCYEDPETLRGPVPGRESRDPQSGKQESFPRTVALLQDSDGILDSVSLTRMAAIFDHTLQDAFFLDVLREAQARR